MDIDYLLRRLTAYTAPATAAIPSSVFLMGMSLSAATPAAT